MTPARRALVLAGGGVAGIAWEVGVVAGLCDGGVDLSEADVVVGTSAGSAVGAQLLSGVGLDQLYAAQVGHETKELSVELDIARFARLGRLTRSDPDTMRKEIGAIALEAETVPESVRWEVVAARLPVHEWPAGRLLLTAVDTATGEFIVFDRSSGASLVDAVAASCAVPAVWPPVTIGDRRFMDGGMRSPTNADLAAGCERVLVIAPFDPSQPFFGDFAKEQAVIEESGGRLETLVADADSTAAIGTNPLDAATRRPAAEAGRAQGRAAASTLRDFWET